MKHALLSALLCCFAHPVAIHAGETAKRVLVVFYSKSGNTEAVAERVKHYTDGDIYQIETVRTYPRERPAALEEPMQELRSGNLPALKGTLPDISAYDLIIIGTPIWNHSFATPVRTFFQEIDFQGKTVAAFCTHGGGGPGRLAADLKTLSRNAVAVDQVLEFSGTYDTGRGPEPDGRAYQNARLGEIDGAVQQWLSRFMNN